MGQKVNPHGLRVGVIKDWDSRWYAEKDFADNLVEDDKIRKYIKNRLYSAGISRTEIERASDRVKIIIHTAKPGIVIGRGGSAIDELKKELEKLKDIEETLILYESPHRIKETLMMLDELMPNRHICLARELTKPYEEYLHGTPHEILEVIDEIKGEIVLVIEGATRKEMKEDLIASTIEKHMQYYLEQGLDEKNAMKMVAKDRGVSKSQIYQQVKKK